MEPVDAVARRILETSRTWAIVGCSPDPGRPSYGVARFLMERGYRVICVNPFAEACFGEPGVGDLRSIDERVDVVDIFRRPDQAGTHVDEAIAIGARAVWMQLGVVDEEAAARARSAGLDVVMDRCPKIEYPRLLSARR